MRITALAVSFFLFGACSGIQTGDDTFVTHAESFVILGMEFPGDDLTTAEGLVPDGAKIETVNSPMADDWTSLQGILNNILGVHMTQISGTL